MRRATPKKDYKFVICLDNKLYICYNSYSKGGCYIALLKDESKGIKSVKNLDYMSDTELFDNIVELWWAYGNGLDLEEFIEIYNKYLTDKDMSTEIMTGASYVGYMIIFYSAYQDRDYR